MENIHALLDKMNGMSRSASALSLLDIDLLMDHTRQLYDELLSLRSRQQQQETAGVAIPVPQPTAEAIPVTAEEPAAVAAPSIPETTPVALPGPMPEAAPAAMTNETAPVTAEEPATVVAPSIQEADPVAIPEAATADETVPVIPEEPKIQMELPAAATSSELYSRKLTHFGVSSRDIRMYIGINDQYNFISELFGNNQEAYEEILDEINTFETKEDALFFLTNSGVTTLYGWEDDHFSVRIFHNVLNQFFSAR